MNEKLVAKVCKAFGYSKPVTTSNNDELVITFDDIKIQAMNEQWFGYRANRIMAASQNAQNALCGTIKEDFIERVTALFESHDDQFENQNEKDSEDVDVTASLLNTGLAWYKNRIRFEGYLLIIEIQTEKENYCHLYRGEEFIGEYPYLRDALISAIRVAVEWKVAELARQQRKRNKKQGANRVGRKPKYTAIVEQLNSTAFYNEIDIANLGRSRKLLAPFVERHVPIGLVHRRVRSTLSAFRRNHGFPVNGDMETEQGRKKWYGFRWKEAYLG